MATAGSDHTLDELRAKLTKSKDQLRQVTKMLQSKPNNDTLKSLKKDLKRVIELTENLVEMKEQKYKDRAPGKDAKSGTVTGPNGKQQPREWGQFKPEYEIGERCQAKFTDGRWYIAQITEVQKAPDGTDGKGYNVLFLEYGNEHVAMAKDMRTYVPPLPEQVKVQDRVRACWSEDGMFYKAIVQKQNADGTFAVEFTKYKNKADGVELKDIQLVKEKKVPVMKHVDKKGWTHVAAEAYIPEKLKATATDSKMKLDEKRMAKRRIKKRHRRLMKEAEQDNRQNSWRRFHKKGLKKAKKNLGASLFKTTKSIFASPEAMDGKVGVYGSGTTMTKFDQRTHYHNIRGAREEDLT